MVSSVTDQENGEGHLSDSVEELRLRLEAMKRMMDIEPDETSDSFKRRKPRCKDSVINSSFLSFVFVAVLLLILGVSFHAFQNLYYAVLKKFHAREHTEL